MAARVLAEISFSGPRAGRWRCMEREAFMAHITMVGQIWMDYFVPALAPDAKIEADGVSVTAAQMRAVIRRGHRTTKALPIYESGVRQNYEAREPVPVESVNFTLPKLDEVATSTHCGGASCAYEFHCDCHCSHCNDARRKEF